MTFLFSILSNTCSFLPYTCSLVQAYFPLFMFFSPLYLFFRESIVFYIIIHIFLLQTNNILLSFISRLSFHVFHFFGFKLFLNCFCLCVYVSTFMYNFAHYLSIHTISNHNSIHICFVSFCGNYSTSTFLYTV